MPWSPRLSWAPFLFFSCGDGRPRHKNAPGVGREPTSLLGCRGSVVRGELVVPVDLLEAPSASSRGPSPSTSSGCTGFEGRSRGRERAITASGLPAGGEIFHV